MCYLSEHGGRSFLFVFYFFFCFEVLRLYLHFIHHYCMFCGILGGMRTWNVVLHYLQFICPLSAKREKKVVMMSQCRQIHFRCMISFPQFLYVVLWCAIFSTLQLYLTLSNYWILCLCVSLISIFLTTTIMFVLKQNKKEVKRAVFCEIQTYAAKSFVEFWFGCTCRIRIPSVPDQHELGCAADPSKWDDGQAQAAGRRGRLGVQLQREHAGWSSKINQ